MDTPNPFNRKRRLTLRWLLAAGSLGLVPLPALIRTALAMGTFGTRQEIKKVRGDVRLNGTPAHVGDPVNYGDIVETGARGMTIFILGRSVYLVRDHTRLELPAESEETLQDKAGGIVRLARGKVLAVLGKRRSRFMTSTAVVGIRGTGLYLEANPDETYVCICYGKASLGSVVTGQNLEDVSTRHHESPRYIYKTPSASGRIIAPAPVINHTDAELILLESMVYRQPPFVYSDRGY